MAIKMLLDNKNGNMWDISRAADNDGLGIVCDISWKTVRFGRPSSLEFNIGKIRRTCYEI